MTLFDYTESLFRYPSTQCVFHQEVPVSRSKRTLAALALALGLTLGAGATAMAGDYETNTGPIMCC